MVPAAVRAWWGGLSGARRRLLKGAVGIALGSLAGFAYYSFVGCSTGSCPITSDPLISTAWGGVIGGFWALG